MHNIRKLIYFWWKYYLIRIDVDEMEYEWKYTWNSGKMQKAMNNAFIYTVFKIL